MSGATIFSVLDAKSSFWQIKLDPASSLLTTFATPFGRFKFLRMPFGINTASEVFQRAMEQIFMGYPCAVIVDDILVGGKGIEEHDKNLKKVLERARQVNLKQNPKKCKFRLKEVSYVGHIFTDEGLKADPTKISAINEMPPPEDKTSLQRFLGMINYLGKFIPNLSELFYDYIYGKPVVIETDHQPLVTIQNKPFHTVPARLQRMILRLQKYNLTLVYKKGKYLYIADTLSHTPTLDEQPLKEEGRDFEEEQEEEAEEEEQEAEGDNDWTARTLSDDEERYCSEDQEDENDEVADHGYVAAQDHGYETPLQLCEDGGSQGKPNHREEGEEAGAEPGRGTWEIWQEDDAGRAAGGVHDLGRDRSHGAVGETRDADVADDYDDDEQEDDEDYEDKDYEEEDDEDKDYEEDEDYEEEEEDEEDDLDPRGRGPTEEAVAAARDEASSFMAYFPPELEDSVMAMTNLEADRSRPAIDGWKPMGRVEFRAYVGLLVFAGVYRSRGEACESLWDAESGRSVFRAAMPLKTFRAYSGALRFDDRETRQARRGEGGGHGYDKLAPIRAVWDEWCTRLPAMYRPGLEVTVDERLVPFRENAIKDGRVSRAIGLCKKLVGHFSHSWKKKAALTEAQKELKLPEHSLITECPTRWGSKEKMIARVLEQMKAISQVLTGDRHARSLIPTWQDAEVLESIHKALHPLSEFTDALSGEEYVSISYLKPVLHLLATSVLAEDAEDTDLTRSIKTKVLAYLNDKYSDLNTQELLDVASFMDPRELRCVKGRAVGSVESVVLGGSAAQGGGEGGGGRGPDTIILSYVAKKNKNVLLLTTAPRYHHRSGPKSRPSRRSSNSKSIGSSSSGGNGGGGKPPSLGAALQPHQGRRRQPAQA
ncbi:uncharacterized protein LOC120436178 [Oreochromis aureus]|uniref:uncharacterized protein LOC120436178 n=1 Tax=Oreochromis aureus TaxID=47969 RepID=UPI001952B7D2|nr:uncharacterized protein LOC120436178 [Oreochromis aureus]